MRVVAEYGAALINARVHYNSPIVPPGFAGITLGSAIHINALRPARPEESLLLKHELVHVHQFQRMGLPKFLAKYVWQWITAGFRYRGIALEEEAYANAKYVNILEVTAP